MVEELQELGAAEISSIGLVCPAVQLKQLQAHPLNFGHDHRMTKEMALNTPTALDEMPEEKEILKERGLCYHAGFEEADKLVEALLRLA